jgi:hypothetical protein
LLLPLPLLPPPSLLRLLLLQLVNLFGSVRDKWISDDLQGWLAPNKIYPGVADALTGSLNSGDTEVYIVTTKQVSADCLTPATLSPPSLLPQKHSSCAIS